MIVSKRHKKTPYKTRVIRRIDRVSRDEWNNLFPPMLEDYSFYRALDESSPEQFSLFYVLVYERRMLVGAAPCFIMGYSLDTGINGPLRRVSNAIKKLKPNVFSLKTLVCGMPMGQGHIGSMRDRADVVKAILRRMDQVAKETNVWFKDFEEYLNTLSPASGYDLRRKFRKVDGHVKFDLDIVDSLDDKTLHEVYRLYLEIVDRHDMGFEMLPMAFFRNVPKNMPGRVKYFLWKIEGRLAAFLFCLVSEDTITDYYAGLDYSIAHKYHLYFVKFRDVLNWCIKNKIKRYEMGITGYEPKRRLGLEFIPLYLYVKLRNRAFRPVFNAVCQFLKFENFDPSLKDAKKMPA
jgi:predicted N-acyltransferase